MIRVTRGIPQYNIQIGPQRDAAKYVTSAILSVTDDFDFSLMQLPLFKWIPINEIGKSWGYLPFYASKKVLDFWCLDMRYPMVYLCCSAGKHRSPMMGFCWLLSQQGATPESVAKKFFGDFEFYCYPDGDGVKKGAQAILEQYNHDVKLGYIPSDLPEFYNEMRRNPGASYRTITQGLLKYERISYTEDSTAISF